MAKSATFGAIHLGIGFSIGWLLTGSVTVAGAMALIEPAANTVAHYFFDRWWTARERRRGALPTLPTPPSRPTPAPAVATAATS
jgi:uncharacterized membrane protein